MRWDWLKTAGPFGSAINLQSMSSLFKEGKDKGKGWDTRTKMHDI